MSRWLKLHRKMKKWEWYSDTDIFRVFTHLLLYANHRPGHWQGVEFLEGQVMSTYPSHRFIIIIIIIMR
jgi:hypothetical protein